MTTVFRLPAVERRHHVAAFRRTIVALELGRAVDERELLVGQLDTVAVGSPSDVAIIKGLPGYYGKAIPLATIASIRSATNEERLAYLATVDEARVELEHRAQEAGR